MVKKRLTAGFFSGSLIGSLGGLIGLGGAEFRLPVLVGIFRFSTLEAVILNKAMSLVVVLMALLFRSSAISWKDVLHHWPIVANLLMGSLVGAWWAAGHAMTISRHWLNRFVLILLVALAVLMIFESLHGINADAVDVVEQGFSPLLWGAGIAAGFLIGIVAAFLGVAGGELLIPTIVLLYGVDIKHAGTLSLMVSLPTMIVGFARYSRSDAFVVLRQERAFCFWMAAGSIAGAWLGVMMLGLFSPQLLMAGLGAILLISAFKTFKHSH
ncbi:sulfite exporter TauE/SafE family protein [Denitratisoma sp. agr-D3]